MLRPRAFLRFYLALFVIDGFLILSTSVIHAGVGWPLEVLDAQLDLAKEANLATWWSSVIFLAAGVLAILNALHDQREIGSKHSAWVWWPVACMFLALSADEIAQLHEWIGGRFRDYLNLDEPAANPHPLADLGVAAWLIPAIPVVLAGLAALALLAWRELRPYPRSLKLALGGVGCWLVTLAAELVEGTAGLGAHGKGIEAPIEEGGELVGATLLLIAFAERLRAERRMRAR